MHSSLPKQLRSRCFSQREQFRRSPAPHRGPTQHSVLRQPQFQNQFPSRERGKANWAHPHLLKAQREPPWQQLTGMWVSVQLPSELKTVTVRSSQGIKASFPTCSGDGRGEQTSKRSSWLPSRGESPSWHPPALFSHLCVSGLCFCFQTPAEARRKYEELTLSLPKQKPPASQQGWKEGQVPVLAVVH